MFRINGWMKSLLHSLLQSRENLNGLHRALLVFSPDAPLDPMQSYKAAINKNVLFKTTFSPDFDEYDFHTPYFDVTKG